MLCAVSGGLFGPLCLCLPGGNALQAPVPHPESLLAASTKGKYPAASAVLDAFLEATALLQAYQSGPASQKGTHPLWLQQRSWKAAAINPSRHMPLPWQSLTWKGTALKARLRWRVEVFDHIGSFVYQSETLLRNDWVTGPRAQAKALLRGVRRVWISPFLAY